MKCEVSVAQCSTVISSGFVLCRFKTTLVYDSFPDYEGLPVDKHQELDCHSNLLGFLLELRHAGHRAQELASVNKTFICKQSAI